MADLLTLAALGGVLVLLVVVILWISRLQKGLRDTQSQITEKLAPVTALTTVATGLQTGVSNIQSAAGDIKAQAEKIATLSQNYQTTEEMTRKIHAIMIGSYSKGRTGEKVLKAMMGELTRTGFVEADVMFGTRVVEYAVKFADGKLLAIDSKVVGTDDLGKLVDDGISEEERDQVARELVRRVRDKIDEVAGYIEEGRTLPFAVMAIPDSLLEYQVTLIGEATKRNVIVLGYSSVPPLIEYFFKIHSAYAVQQDVEKIYESLAAVNNALSKFTDRYFSYNFAKPLKTLSNAVGEVQDGVRSALVSSNSQAMLNGSKVERPPELEQQEEARPET